MLSLKSHYTQLISQFSEGKKSLWGGSSPQSNAGANLTSDVVDMILAEAVAARASDIHIEHRPTNFVVRYRVDGVLYDVLEIEKSTNITVIPRLKILANLPTDSASSRKAWDGRFTRTIAGHDFDFRIATFPTILGDKVALRLLNKEANTVNLKKIGLCIPDYDRLERMIQRKQGLLIVSGPTGGGKTTTLYSILSYLHTPAVNIVTLEDPVEYQITGINQCDLRNSHKGEKDEENFATGLKAVLRQDPNVILVGEIRDKETAEIAIRASITGHLVLTSVHANDAIGTIVRLINMGLERHIVSYALIGSIAQRLVRRICEHCRVAQRIETPMLNRICQQCGLNPKMFSEMAKTDPDTRMHYLHSSDTSDGSVTFYKGKGCEHCVGTGYRGRLGIFEVLQFTDEFREAVLRQAPITELRTIAANDGFQTLAMDALRKVKSGQTTIDDVYPILLERPA